MSMPYQVMYRVGFTPWDRHDPPAPLADLVATMPAGQMLDIGCGTGRDAIWCATRGWQVRKYIRREREWPAGGRSEINILRNMLG